MTTKKSDSGSNKLGGTTPGVDTPDSGNEIEERKRRRAEATTVDGSESFPPPGMDLPDGGTVPLDEDQNAPAAKE